MREVLPWSERENYPSHADRCVLLFFGLACLAELDALFSKSRFQVGRVCGIVILRNMCFTHEGCPQNGRVAKGSPRGGGAGENPLRRLPCILRVVEDCPPTFWSLNVFGFFHWRVVPMVLACVS